MKSWINAWHLRLETKAWHYDRTFRLRVNSHIQLIGNSEQITLTSVEPNRFLFGIKGWPTLVAVARWGTLCTSDAFYPRISRKERNRAFASVPSWSWLSECLLFLSQVAIDSALKSFCIAAVRKSIHYRFYMSSKKSWFSVDFAFYMRKDGSGRIGSTRIRLQLVEFKGN